MRAEALAEELKVLAELAAVLALAGRVAALKEVVGQVADEERVQGAAVRAAGAAVDRREELSSRMRFARAVEHPKEAEDDHPVPGGRPVAADNALPQWLRFREVADETHSPPAPTR